MDTRGPGVDGQPKQRINYFLCFDVEATCSPGVDFKYPNEIIVGRDQLPPCWLMFDVGVPCRSAALVG